MSLVRGIDVSSVQGHNIDWSRVASQGVRFVYCKAAENDWADGTFAGNVAGAKAAELVTGAYLIPHPGGAKPDVQAKAHHDMAAGLGELDGDLPPAVDFEVPSVVKPSHRDFFLAYLRAVRAYFGCRPMLYTYPYWWNSLTGPGEPAFSEESLLWVAAYGVHDWPGSSACPILKPWQNWTMWQWIGGMPLAGVGNVDCNVFNGDETALAALLTSE